MTKEAVVDTNVLVAVMIEDDENHSKALSIWESLHQAFVPTVVLLELAFFLVKYKLGLQYLEAVITDPKVRVVENNLDDLMFLVHYASAVKYYDDIGDLMIGSVSKRLEMEIKTFDKDLQKLIQK